MKLLLTDNSHALGEAIEHELEREPFALIRPESARLNWTDIGEVRAWVEHQRPRLIINTLGWADRPDRAHCALIPRAAKVLAQVCDEQRLAMIQLSSYQVFGGDSKSSHAEKDDPMPQSDTGQAWLAAEQAVNERLSKRLILRLSWLIGSHGDNRLTRLLAEVFDDQQSLVPVHNRLKGAPTALSDAARVVVGLVKQISCGAENWGVMHYASREPCSEADFAQKILDVLQQLDALPAGVELDRLESLPSDEPLSAVLSGRRLRDGFGVQARAWEPYLVPMIKQWLYQRSSGQ